MAFNSKTPRLKSKKITDSAKGEDCQLNIAGVCNHSSETVVFAHFPYDSGMGTKPSDFSGAYACSACHDAIDGRNMPELQRLIDQGEYEWYLRRAQNRLIESLINKDIIKVKGAK